ncbi:hypothetical protein ABID21_001573 [Pseudorhizobium tarimense]|uniref:DUF1127 domain-containing protein n=1 Tax=Pseudorhizobium tarimense TaxID=1079109 RepID=A0ABV2H4I1_9HYPH|nr:hypothetical protein [Pseudorhizobium tarimense]MCJ8518688.1 hypothetical protein [Pseudorhizobium tarimense]
MAFNSFVAALARLRERWSGGTGGRRTEPSVCPSQLTARQLLDQHLMRDIGFRQDRWTSWRGKTFLDI